MQEDMIACCSYYLDDTLYPLSSGLAAACRKNIEDFMSEKLGIEENKIPDLCTSLYKNYGTTLAGLRAIGYKIDYDEYHRFVHGRLPYDNLKPDPTLRNLLLSLPMQKLIFTNADKSHAAKALSKLGLEGCFEGIICFETLNPVNDTNEEVEGDGGFTKDFFDILGMDSNSGLPTTPVVCKPSSDAWFRLLRLPMSILRGRKVVGIWAISTQRKLFDGSPEVAGTRGGGRACAVKRLQSPE